MQSADHDVLSKALAWAREGVEAALVTVVQTAGPAPRPPGSIAALTCNGVLVGSISGGCIEEDLRERLAANGPPETPTAITYGLTRDEAERMGLPCGGTLELVIERLPAATQLAELVRSIDEHRLITRRLAMASGASELVPAAAEHPFRYDGQAMERLFGPTWTLIIVGAGQIGRYLAEMALALDYHVLVCEPRAIDRDAWRVEGVSVVATMPDELVRERVDRRTAVVTLTHDPKIDDMALMEALISPAFYVGALGSERTSLRRRTRLIEHLELPDAAVDRLHGPVGLPLGGRRPAEIALSIMAEITALRHERCLVLQST